MPTNIRRYTGVFAHAGLQRARESALTASAKRAARLLEEAGEGGDRHLIHVSDNELAAIRAAFSPGGHPGRHNAFTGLESFATENTEEPEDTSPGGMFVGTDPDGSSYVVRMPGWNVDPAAAGYETLRRILPGQNPAQGVPETPGRIPVAEDSWRTVLGKGVRNAPSEFQRDFGGLGRAIGEALSAQPTIPPEVGMTDATVQGYAPPAAKTLTDWSTRLHDDAVADLIANAPNVDPNSAKGFAYDVVSGLPQMAVLLASAATGTALPAVGALALQGFGSRYGEARQQGRTAAQATGDAAAHAVATSLPAFIPVGMLMRPGGSFLGRTLSQMGAGGAQGALTQAMDEAYATGIIGSDTRWDEAWDRIKRAGFVGAATGAVPGAIRTAARPSSRPEQLGLTDDSPTNSIGLQNPNASAEAWQPGASNSLLQQFDKFRQEQGFSSQEAAPGFLREVGRNTGHEHLLAIDERTGEPVALTTSSQRDWVQMTPRLLEIARDPGRRLIVHHNHPEESTLGADDLALLSYPGISQIVVHTPNGGMASAALTPGFQPASERLIDVVETLIRGANKHAMLGADSVLWPAARDGHIDFTARVQALPHIVNQALARIGLINYHSNFHPILPPPYFDDAARSALARARQFGL